MIRGTTRRLLVLLHRWLALSVGLVFGVAVLTGAPLAFQPEIDQALSAEAFDPTPGDVGWETALAAIEGSLAQGERIGTFWWPRPQMPVYNALIVAEDGSDRTAYLDPGTGALLEPQTSGLTEWLTYLHTSLFAGDVGYWVVVVATVLSIPILVSGLFLWWPGIGTLWRGLRVRIRKGTYALNYDLHQVTGFLAAVPLLVMCVTGVVLTFPEASRVTLQWALGEEPSGKVDWSEVRAPGPPLDWDPADRLPPRDFLQIAEAAVEGEHHRFYLAFPDPRDPQDVVHTRLQIGYDPPPFGTTIRVAHNPYTGEILQIIDPRTDRAVDRFVDSAAHSWHVGSFGGFWSKLLYFVSCLAGVLMVVTGMVVWWKKRNVRLARDVRSGESGARRGRGAGARPRDDARAPAEPAEAYLTENRSL